MKAAFRSVSHQSPSRVFSLVVSLSSSDLARPHLVGTEDTMSCLGANYVQPSHRFHFILASLFICLQLRPSSFLN